MIVFVVVGVLVILIIVGGVVLGGVDG